MYLSKSLVFGCATWLCSLRCGQIARGEFCTLLRLGHSLWDCFVVCAPGCSLAQIQPEIIWSVDGDKQPLIHCANLCSCVVEKQQMLIAKQKDVSYTLNFKLRVDHKRHPCCKLHAAEFPGLADLRS